jgi:hypothetical protein
MMVLFFARCVDIALANWLVVLLLLLGLEMLVGVLKFRPMHEIPLLAYEIVWFLVCHVF